MVCSISLAPQHSGATAEDVSLSTYSRNSHTFGRQLTVDAIPDMVGVPGLIAHPSIYPEMALPKVGKFETGGPAMAE
jgi:hypothetical protein